VILLVVSLATPAPPPEKTTGLTFASKRPVESTSNAAWRRKDLILSVGLVLCVFAVWIYFRG
jgi:hypothetical protein